MAHSKHAHTFSIFSNFRVTLDAIIAKVIADRELGLEVNFNSISYDDIKSSFAKTSTDNTNKSEFELGSYLDDLVLQITYSNVLLNTPLEPYFSLAHTLRDALREEIRIEGVSLDSDRWLSTLRVAYFYSLRPSYHKSSPSAKHETYARAIAYFNKRNIDVQLNDLDIKFPSYNTKLAVAETVNIPLRKLGGAGGMDFIDQLLITKYDRNINRLRLHPNPDTMGRKNERQVPLGLLYRMSLKNLHTKSSAISAKACYAPLIQSATHMASLHDVEPFSVYETILPPKPSKIINFLTQITTYDELFLIPQCDPKVIESLLENLKGALVSTDATAKLGWSINDAIKLWYLLKQESSHPVRSVFVNQIDLQQSLSQFVGSHTAASLLKSFAFEKINVDYNYPTDAFRGNTRDCCIAQARGNKFWIPGSLILAPTFFSRLISLRAEHSPGFNNALGVGFEDYLINRLNTIGINCKRGALKGRSKGETAGDIDLLLETDETIALFELKKKTLCRASTAGNGLQLLIDLTHGLIQGVAQISKHEITLLKEKRLVFRDDTVVDLNNRRIIKFVISLSDFGSFHDTTTTENILMSLAGAGFNINAELDPKKKKDIELATKYCKDLGERFLEFQSVTNDPKAELFYNFSFLNIFQVEYLLSNVHSAENFLNALRRGSRTTFGMRDRIVESALLDPSTMRQSS